MSRAHCESSRARSALGGGIGRGGVRACDVIGASAGAGGWDGRRHRSRRTPPARNNSARSTNGTVEGGGLRNALGGTATLTRTPVSGNTADATGGTALGAGVFNGADSTTSLKRSPVKANTARASGGSANGGGIFNEASLGAVTLTSSRVSGNRPNNCAPPGSVPGCTG